MKVNQLPRAEISNLRPTYLDILIQDFYKNFQYPTIAYDDRTFNLSLKNLKVYLVKTLPEDLMSLFEDTLNGKQTLVFTRKNHFYKIDSDSLSYINTVFAFDLTKDFNDRSDSSIILFDDIDFPALQTATVQMQTSINYPFDYHYFLAPNDLIIIVNNNNIHCIKYKSSITNLASGTFNQLPNIKDKKLFKSLIDRIGAFLMIEQMS